MDARTGEALDASLALSRVGGDLDFLLDVVGIALAACPSLIQDLRGAIGRRDLRAVKKSTRLVRTVADNVSARRTYTHAVRVETLACYGEWESARHACANLQLEIDRLRPALAELEEALWFSHC